MAKQPIQFDKGYNTAMTLVSIITLGMFTILVVNFVLWLVSKGYIE